MSFKNITPEEYNRIVKNKNRISDMTFKTPERLNKYRDDKNIYNEMELNEKYNKKLKDYDKAFHENLDEYFIENLDKKNIEEVSRYNYNIIKNKEKDLENKDNEIKSKDNELENKDNKMKNLRESYIRSKINCSDTHHKPSMDTAPNDTTSRSSHHSFSSAINRLFTLVQDPCRQNLLNKHPKALIRW